MVSYDIQPLSFLGYRLHEKLYLKCRPIVFFWINLLFNSATIVNYVHIFIRIAKPNL